jgi:hypothetical protein
MDVARRENESDLAGHGKLCYHFRVKATALGLLALLALAGTGCTRSIQPEDDSDPAIKARVELALHGRKDLDIRYVSIDVNGGVVTISGIVPELGQIRAIERLVKNTPGVDQLMDNLVVQE